jgi:hypothetical protein
VSDAVKAVLATPAPEDAGARVASLLDWQACTAAVDALACLRLCLDTGATPHGAILCEHHEDWVVIGTSTAVLVSCKHKDIAVWTYAELFVDGGVAHLFARWRTTGRTCRTRLVTNGALSGSEAANLNQTCQLLSDEAAGTPIDDDSREAVDDLIRDVACRFMHYAGVSGLSMTEAGPATKAIAKHQPSAELLLDVRTFLAGFVMDTMRIGRSHLRYAAPGLYVRDVLQRRGDPLERDAAAWEAVASMFRERMRGLGALAEGELASVAAHLRGETSEEQLARHLSQRMISLEAVAAAIDLAVARPGAFTSPRLPSTTVLGTKLEAGGCGPTLVSMAERMRARWLLERRRLLEQPGAHEDVERLLTQLSLTAIEAEMAARAKGVEPYGEALWLDLAQRTQTMQRPVVIGDDAVLGALMEKTSECDLWFSPRFDPVVAIAKAHAVRAAVGAP